MTGGLRTLDPDKVKQICFSPCANSSVQVKICHSRGKAYAVKAVATHDHGTVDNEDATWHMIDAAFHKRLPGGRSAQVDGAACVRLSGVEAKVVGMLPSIETAFKIVSDEFNVPEDQRYALQLPLHNVLVVSGLPVPLHVSVRALTRTVTDSSTMAALLDACESPGLDGRGLVPALFPASYQKHAYWITRAELQPSRAADQVPAVVDISSNGSSAPGSMNFEAAHVFAGARNGRIFKQGPLGLGYYLDTPQVPAPWLRPQATTARWSWSRDLFSGIVVAVLALAIAAFFRQARYAQS